jgi:hypothetical protein
VSSATIWPTYLYNVWAEAKAAQFQRNVRFYARAQYPAPTSARLYAYDLWKTTQTTVIPTRTAGGTNDFWASHTRQDNRTELWLVQLAIYSLHTYKKIILDKIWIKH